MFRLNMGKRSREESRQLEREEKRIAISIDSLLRERLGWPYNPRGLVEPQPVDEVVVLAFLWERANNKQ